MALNQSTLLSYGACALGFVGAMGSFIGGSGSIIGFIGAILAGLGGIFTILFYKYGYIFVPIITGQTKISTNFESAYEIPPNQDAILKKGASGIYYASMFLGIRIFESATEKNVEENIAYNEYFERAISNMKYVTKISYLLYVENISEKRKIIETRRAEAQLRLARERDKPESDPLKLDRYEREVAKWDGELNKLIKGIKPMGALVYAMTTATGITKESALAAARSQAQELKAVLTNALNVEIDVLTADEMLKTFEWEKTIPSTPQELEDMVM
ncbi:MAG: hypothetical protein AB1391_01965 [Candidatus Micrarchaeota archaeon]